MTSARQTGSDEFRAAANLVAWILAGTAARQWTAPALEVLQRILTDIDAAAAASDESRMWRAHAALVELGEGLRIQPQPTSTGPKPPSPANDRFPHERVNELIDRLHNLAGGRDPDRQGHGGDLPAEAG